jgi:heme oxygenase
VAQGKQGYGKFLQASAAAIYPLETALLAAGVNDILADWHERSRAEAIRLDLDDMGAPAPAIRPAPCFRGEAFQFGVLYVLEGSRLGAQVLTERVMALDDHRIQAATRYLRHGEGKRFWPTFLERLETSASVRHSQEIAVAGALEAFSWFSAQLPAASNPEPADAG